MMSKTGQQIIPIHIFCNILKSKDIQTIKFGQLIGYKITNIFFEKSYTKCGGEASPRPFNKKTKLEYISESIA